MPANQASCGKKQQVSLPHVEVRPTMTWGDLTDEEYQHVKDCVQCKAALDDETHAVEMTTSEW